MYVLLYTCVSICPPIPPRVSKRGYIIIWPVTHVHNGIQQGDDKIAKMLRNGAQSAATTALMYALLGAGTGGTATKTKARVVAQNGQNVGAPQIETINLINRATTAADLTAIQALFNRVVQPASYPADLSGNGGGGHVTY
jgi:hypothetical protein